MNAMDVNIPEHRNGLRVTSNNLIIAKKSINSIIIPMAYLI